MMIQSASFKCLLAIALLALTATPAQADITIDMVPVWNTGNTADGTGYGAVGYPYLIGTYYDSAP